MAAINKQSSKVKIWSVEIPNAAYANVKSIGSINGVTTFKPLILS